MVLVELIIKNKEIIIEEKARITNNLYIILIYDSIIIIRKILLIIPINNMEKKEAFLNTFGIQKKKGKEPNFIKILKTKNKFITISLITNKLLGQNTFKIDDNNKKKETKAGKI